MSKNYYIGLMSGTSFDGVDVVLCAIDKKQCQLIDSIESSFDNRLKSDIKKMISSGETELSKQGGIDHRLGMLFADAVNALLKKSGKLRGEIVAIGSHGQTVWHQPGGEYPFSMQLGDPNVIVAETGIPVVADFRRMDMALGGQGAPFAPAFHQFLFGDLERKTAVVNIGGMANITVLGKSLIGYDTGPGNVLMDSWIEEIRGEKFDRDGEWAASGRVIPGLLNAMLSDSYFSQKAPKSTGREKFNLEWLKRVRTVWGRDFSRGISSAEISFSRLKSRPRDEDVQRTLLELTAQTIADEVQKYDRELLLLCGGGAKNRFLFERIATLLPDCKVASTDDYGVSGDFMEAMAFAWLAYKRVHREPVELMRVTGARENGILGGFYE